MGLTVEASDGNGTIYYVNSFSKDRTVEDKGSIAEFEGDVVGSLLLGEKDLVMSSANVYRDKKSVSFVLTERGSYGIASIDGDYLPKNGERVCKNGLLFQYHPVDTQSQ